MHFPEICSNLNTDHSALLDIYHAIDAMPDIKKTFIGSGIRYDMLLHKSSDKQTNQAAENYIEEVIVHHVSGRLKVAPEHTSDNVLRIMRKPSFNQFLQFKKIFDSIDKKYSLNQQLIPYFISSHPGCTLTDMAELAVTLKNLNIKPKQVQDFTPSPMTLATEIYYTGYHPYTLEPVYCARTKRKHPASVLLVSPLK